MTGRLVKLISADKSDYDYVSVGHSSYVVYDTSTGRIIQSGHCSPTLEPHHVISPDHDYLCVDEVFDPNLYRVDLATMTVVVRDDVVLAV